jgi:hypothetical protein
MKKFLGIVVLGLFLSFNANADDIKDFQIDGVSIGDSILDYYSEETIKKETEEVWPNTTYVQFCSEDNLNDFQYLCFAYLKKDKKYIIHEFYGGTDLSFDNCLKELELNVSALEGLFSSAKINTRKRYKHRSDKKKKTIGSDVQFILKDGSVARVNCTDWSDEITEKKDWIDGLSISLATKKFIKWNRTKAFK